MPEGLEAEIWRRAASSTIGRTITSAWVDERTADPGLATLVVGESIVDVRRRGKVVLVDTTGPSIGLHFGMTGRLAIDGVAPIELTYASGRDDPNWDRLRVFTGADVAALRLNDPRRLGRVSLDPDLDGFGVDIDAVTARRLARALTGRRAVVKSLLLDQHVVAGLGNLCADEVLWWAGVAPHRSAHTLVDDEVAALARTIRTRLPTMRRRGGSTHGTLTPDVRAHCPPCPRCGTPLRRESIGGRTAVWCAGHQR